VQLILDARKEGKFSDLNDFIRRVDLHRVGKRSLECLIKVGALDCFGPRRSLLEVVDTMLSVSNSHFRAAECGQLSIFGSVAGLEEDIHLPPDSGIDSRLQLEWEKELMGLYVSDHPISPYLPLMRQRVTHFSKDLAEVAHKQKATVAGMVTRIRTTMTKKSNKQMAFATIEDLQGAVELVIFPRTWETYGALVRMETVIVVDGTVDAEGSEPKILADIIRPLSEEELNAFQQTGASEDGEAVSEPWQADIDTERFSQQYEDGYEEPPPSMEEASWTTAPSAASAIAEEAPTPIAEVVREISTEIIAPIKQEVIVEVEVEQKVIRETTQQPSADSKSDQPPVIMAPLPPLLRYGDNGELKLVTVTIKTCGEKERDLRRIRRVHSVLNSFPGRDRFCFMVYEHGYRHLLDFPNDTTSVNTELINQLSEIVGHDNIRVENIH
jgi:DNA polymerase-3 subunit alpha